MRAMTEGSKEAGNVAYTNAQVQLRRPAYIQFISLNRRSKIQLFFVQRLNAQQVRSLGIFQNDVKLRLGFQVT
jgi:hypothetical protein